jgi:phosphatidylserine/phosphatidylglycerophosphate/cardiolipin synthase-like enzyme
MQPQNGNRSRHTDVLLLVCLLLAGCDQRPPGVPSIEVFFSPKGGCTEKIVAELGAAQSRVLVQAYSFTSAPIADALVAAARRGVQTQVILDKSQETEKYSSADFLIHSGIPTRIDPVHDIAHNKIMIIDDRTVITGSFNFTRAAEEHNAENMLVIRDPQLAERYTSNWYLHAGHSVPYRRGEAAEPSGRSRASAGGHSSHHAEKSRPNW